jgi:hypothetical protein
MEINEEVTDPKTRRVNHEPISRAMHMEQLVALFVAVWRPETEVVFAAEV